MIQWGYLTVEHDKSFSGFIFYPKIFPHEALSIASSTSRPPIKQDRVYLHDNTKFQSIISQGDGSGTGNQVFWIALGY